MGEERYSADTSGDRLRLPVPEAAKALGISPEAVRNRLSRGTLESIKESGTVYVLIDRDRLLHAYDISSDRSGESSALISEMRARIESLERQLEQANERDRENRRIIAALTSRIPELPASQEQARESPESATSPGPTGTPTDAHQGPQEAAQRPWWRRIFGA